MPNEKIEVGYRHIGTVAGVEYHHKFLLYTDKTGKQYTISGWTGNESTQQLPLGKIHVEVNLPYDANNPDNMNNQKTAWYKDKNQKPVSPQKQYRELIAEAPDLSDKWAEMVKNARSKDNVYPYDYLRQNSNTLADTVLREAGFPEPEKDGRKQHLAPGSGNRLDKTLKPLNPDKPGGSDLWHGVGEVFSLEENTLEKNALQTAENKPKEQPGYDEFYAMIQGLLNDKDGSFAEKLLAENKHIVDAFDARVQEETERLKQQQLAQENEKAMEQVQQRHYGGRSFG